MTQWIGKREEDMYLIDDGHIRGAAISYDWELYVGIMHIDRKTGGVYMDPLQGIMLK